MNKLSSYISVALLALACAGSSAFAADTSITTSVNRTPITTQYQPMTPVGYNQPLSNNFLERSNQMILPGQLFTNAQGNGAQAPLGITVTKDQYGNPIFTSTRNSRAQLRYKTITVLEPNDTRSIEQDFSNQNITLKSTSNPNVFTVVEVPFNGSQFDPTLNRRHRHYMKHK